MKRTVALTLALVMMLTTVAFAANTPSDWAVEDLENAKYVPATYLEEFGVEMDYQRSITREEFCFLALRAYNALKGSATDVTIENPFLDVDHPLILMAYGLGIIKGVSDTSFAPNNNVTRQEMCVMLTRVITATKGEIASDEIVNASGAYTDPFADNALVADWAKNQVGFIINKGIMKGVSETQIDPLGNCSIEQALILVNRMIENLK